MKRSLHFGVAVTLLSSCIFAATAAPEKARFPLTTPEGAMVETSGEPIVSFIAALNRKDFKDAVTYVAKVEPRTGFAEIEGTLKTLDAQYTLTSYEARNFGNVILAQVQGKVKGLPQGDLDSRETLLLRREDATWKIVPGDRYRVDVARADKWLLQMATMLARPEFYRSGISRTEFLDAKKNMGQLAGALYSLMQENQHIFALTAESFEESLLPFLPSVEALVDPYLGKGKISYSFNEHLAGLSLEAIPDAMPDPKEVVAIYEGKDGKLDFRHSGIAFVATVNTLGKFHIEGYTAETAKTLNWQP